LNEYFNCEQDITQCWSSLIINQEAFPDIAEDIDMECAKVTYEENSEDGESLDTQACVVSEWCGTMVKNNVGEFEVFCSSGGMYFSYFVAGLIIVIAAVVIISLLVCLKYTGGLANLSKAAKKARQVNDNVNKLADQVKEGANLVNDVKNVDSIDQAVTLGEKAAN
jgi:hypothetical protein